MQRRTMAAVRSELESDDALRQATALLQVCPGI